MKKLLCVLLALLLSACAALAEVPQIPLDDYPRVDGSTATLPLSYALMQAATGVTEDEAKLAIAHSKTTESFYALIDGTAELLLVYAPSQDAFDYADSMGVELEMKPITRDALVFLINTENPVDSLTHEQVLGIYTGKLKNWAEVGGDDMEIIAYQRIENSGSQVMMKAQVMKDVEMAEAPTELRPGEMDMLVNMVASYKNTANAIGYSVYYYVHNMYMQEGIKLMSAGGVLPSNETIGSGEYPYTQDVYAVIRKDAPADSPARRLYDFLGTSEADPLVEAAGYVVIEHES